MLSVLRLETSLVEAFNGWMIVKSITFYVFVIVVLSQITRNVPLKLAALSLEGYHICAVYVCDLVDCKL